MEKTFWLLRMKKLCDDDKPILVLFAGKPICKDSGETINARVVAPLTNERGEEVPGYKDLKWENGPVEIVIIEKRAVEIAKGVIVSQKMMIAKLKCCGNCEHEMINTDKEPCLECYEYSNWSLAQMGSVCKLNMEKYELDIHKK